MPKSAGFRSIAEATRAWFPAGPVNDLVFHNGKWAGVAAKKLGALDSSGSAGEDDPDEVWEGKKS